MTKHSSVFPLEPKEYSTHIILNYRTGNFRLRNREPRKSELSAHEIMVKFNLKVNIPETPKIETTGEITLTETKIDEMRTQEVVEQL